MKKYPVSPTDKFQLHYFLNRAKESFMSEGNKKKFLDSLDTENFENLAKYIELKEALYEELYMTFNSEVPQV